MIRFHYVCVLWTTNSCQMKYKCIVIFNDVYVEEKSENTRIYR